MKAGASSVWASCCGLLNEVMGTGAVRGQQPGFGAGAGPFRFAPSAGYSTYPPSSSGSPNPVCRTCGQAFSVFRRKYINAEASSVFLIDPAQVSSELVDSENAAKRIKEYFKMRRTCHGKTDWVGIQWKGGTMCHPVQQDGSSCGVIVVKDGKSTDGSLPSDPDVDFDTRKKAMKSERRTLALQILDASVFDEHSWCAMCAAYKAPGSGPGITEWIQCDNCDRWFHALCLNMKRKEFQKSKTGSWKCLLCI